MHKSRIHAVCLLLSFTCLCHADEPLPYYAGVSIGITQNQSSTQDLIRNPSRCSNVGADCSLDKSDTAWQVFAGYQATPRLAVEAGWLDLGKVTGSVNQGGVSDRYTQITSGLSLAAIGRLNAIDQTVSLYGKAGTFYWNSKVSAALTPALGSLGTVASRKERDFSPLLGLGVRYPINGKLAVRADWEHIFSVGKHAVVLDEASATLGTQRSDADVYMLGLVYHF